MYPPESAVVYPVLGLVSEAGEVAGKLKKLIRDQGGQLTPASTEALLDELGDCLWYLDRTAADLGSTLEAVAIRNRNKLQDRLERGVLQGSGDQR